MLGVEVDPVMEEFAFKNFPIETLFQPCLVKDKSLSMKSEITNFGEAVSALFDGVSLNIKKDNSLRWMPYQHWKTELPICYFPLLRKIDAMEKTQNKMAMLSMLSDLYYHCQAMLHELSRLNTHEYRGESSLTCR